MTEIIPYESNQQVFEIVVKHLFSQGAQSKKFIEEVDRDCCVYRGDSGTSCAIGRIIPDEIYDPIMDIQRFTIWTIISDEFPEILELFKNIGCNFLSSLQTLHDTDSAWLSTHAMQLAVIGVACKHSLNSSFVQNLSFKDR